MAAVNIHCTLGLISFSSQLQNSTPQQLTSGQWHLKKKTFRHFVNTIAQFTNMLCIHIGFYE
jgi:hypothetical protein